MPSHNNNLCIPLNVLGVSFSHSMSGAYALILQEQTGAKRIPVVIGDYEAQSIARQLEGIVLSRPQTHDLIISLLHAMQVELEQVGIYKLLDGVFYAHLHLMGHNGTRTLVDARTSDAVALAVRLNVPIYTTPHILDAAGIPVDFGEHSDAHSGLTQGKDLEHAGMTDLQDLLSKAIEVEDYEQAAKIRDEIKRRG